MQADRQRHGHPALDEGSRTRRSLIVARIWIGLLFALMLTGVVLSKSPSTIAWMRETVPIVEKDDSALGHTLDGIMRLSND